MQQRGLRTRQLECEAFLLSSTFTPPAAQQPNAHNNRWVLIEPCVPKKEKRRERERAPGQVVGGSQS